MGDSRNSPQICLVNFNSQLDGTAVFCADPYPTQVHLDHILVPEDMLLRTIHTESAFPFMLASFKNAHRGGRLTPFLNACHDRESSWRNTVQAGRRIVEVRDRHEMGT